MLSVPAVASPLVAPPLDGDNVVVVGDAVVITVGGTPSAGAIKSFAIELVCGNTAPSLSYLS